MRSHRSRREVRFLRAVLIRTSLMVSDVEHLFTHLWAMCVSSPEKRLFGSRFWPSMWPAHFARRIPFPLSGENKVR